MGTGYGDAVEGWVQLAQWLVNSWGTRVNKIANRVDSGSYTANEAATDLVDLAYLAAESTFLVGNEVVEAAAVLSGDQNLPRPIVSGTFHAKQAPTFARTLELDGPLTSPLAASSIPVSAVTIVPGPRPADPPRFPPPGSGPPFLLAANVTVFHLYVMATGFDGVGYLGNVKVHKAGSTESVDTVMVWIQVP
jgi:hypothetical protein